MLVLDIIYVRFDAKVSLIFQQCSAQNGFTWTINDWIQETKEYDNTFGFVRTFEINHKRIDSVLVSINSQNRQYKIGDLAFWMHSLQRGRNHT